MAQGYHLNRRFSWLYGAAGIWGIAGGGILILTSGQYLFGALLIALALVLLVLIATGKILKEKDYSGTDIFFLFVPIVGVIIFAGVYFAVFPWSFLVLIYLAVFIILSVLAIAEARSSSTQK